LASETSGDRPYDGLIRLPAFRKTSEFETSRHKMRMAVSGRIWTPMTPSLSLNQAVRQRRLRAHALAAG
jgi:hypothetical protein